MRALDFVNSEDPDEMPQNSVSLRSAKSIVRERNKILGEIITIDPSLSSSQAKVSKSTSFLTHVRNEVDLEPLACEDDSFIQWTTLT